MSTAPQGAHGFVLRAHPETWSWSPWLAAAGAALLLVGFAGYEVAWALPHRAGAFGIISGVPYRVPSEAETACSILFALGWTLLAGRLIAARTGLRAGLALGLASYTAIGCAGTLWQIVRAGEDVRAVVHPYVVLMALTWPERLATAVLFR